MKNITEPSVAKVFDSYPELYRRALLELRQLIFDTAKSLSIVGEVTESLKWQQPSYATKTGTPIRIHRFEQDKIALFVPCQTTLIEDFKSLFGNTLIFSKNRAIVLDPTQKLPTKELVICIEMALTYHKNNKKGKV